MTGESPFNMMQSTARPQRRLRAPRRRRLWPWLVLLAIALALGWTWLWYYAASIAGRALNGWVEREAAVGRVYTCGTQSIGGFPFSFISRCTDAAADFRNNRPPFDVKAGDVTFSAQVFRPTLLTGDIAGPVTLADPGQPPIFVANWTDARLSLLGLPPEPERIAVELQKPRLDRVAGPGSGMIFQAERVAVDGRIVAGTARDHPVIEATGHFTGATAPGFHPLLAEPLQGDIDAVLRGFKDFSPKPWPALFHDMQQAGGGIEIRSLRIERPDAVIVGAGTVTINEHGRLDGLIRIDVAGIDTIVPLLGLDRLIGQSIDKLTGGGGSPAQGLGTLDRLLPGLSDVVRKSANAGIIENIKKMGQPTEIDKRPAVALPLRVADGTVYLGLIPLGVLPALF